MMKVLVLICAAAMPAQDCTTETALSVINAPDATNEITCAMEAQAWLAQTSLIRPGIEAYPKAVCMQRAPLAGTAAREWGGKPLDDTHSAAVD